MLIPKVKGRQGHGTGKTQPTGTDWLEGRERENKFYQRNDLLTCPKATTKIRAESITQLQICFVVTLCLNPGLGKETPGGPTPKFPSLFECLVIDAFSVQNAVLIYSNVRETTENPATDLDLSIPMPEIWLSLIKDKKQFTVS